MTWTALIEKTSLKKQRCFKILAQQEAARSVNEILQPVFRTSVWFIVVESNKLTLKIISGL